MPKHSCATCGKGFLTQDGHFFSYGHYPPKPSPIHPKQQQRQHPNLAEGRHCSACRRLLQLHFALKLCPKCDRILLSACLRAEKFSTYRGQDITRRDRHVKELDSRIQAFRSKAPALSPSVARRRLDAILNRAARIGELSREISLSPIRYRMARSRSTPSAGRPRRSTIHPQLSAIVAVARDDVKLPPGAILEALGSDGCYKRLNQHLHTGRLTHDEPFHRELKREILALPSSARNKRCFQLLRQNARHFIGRHQ